MALCRGCGALPMIVAWPVRTQAAGAPQSPPGHQGPREYQEVARRVAERQGASFVDLLPAVAGRPELYIDVVHLGPEGYARVADVLAARLAPALATAGGAAATGSARDER